MGTKDSSTPEDMAAELNQSFDEAQARAEARPSLHPAQLPAHPRTGTDEPDDVNNDH